MGFGSLVCVNQLCHVSLAHHPQPSPSFLFPGCPWWCEACILRGAPEGGAFVREAPCARKHQAPHQGVRPVVLEDLLPCWQGRPYHSRHLPRLRRWLPPSQPLAWIAPINALIPAHTSMHISATQERPNVHLWGKPSPR